LTTCFFLTTPLSNSLSKPDPLLSQEVWKLQPRQEPSKLQMPLHQFPQLLSIFILHVREFHTGAWWPYVPHHRREMSLPKPGADLPFARIAQAEFLRRLQVRPPQRIVFTRAIPACEPSKRPRTVNSARYRPLLEFRSSLHKT